MHTCDGCYYLADDGYTCLRESYPKDEKPRNSERPKDEWYVRWFKAFIALFRKEKS